MLNKHPSVRSTPLFPPIPPPLTPQLRPLVLDLQQGHSCAERKKNSPALSGLDGAPDRLRLLGDGLAGCLAAAAGAQRLLCSLPSTVRVALAETVPAVFLAVQL